MAQKTRRRFLKTAAVAAVMPWMTTAPGAQAGEPPTSADEALISLVRLRYKYLSEEQLRAVQRGLRGELASADVLKRTRLELTDAPATIFSADVAE